MRVLKVLLLVLTVACATLAFAEDKKTKGSTKGSVEWEYDADEEKLSVCWVGTVSIGKNGVSVKACASGDKNDGQPPQEKRDIDLPWLEEWWLEFCAWGCISVNVGIEIHDDDLCTPTWCKTVY